LICYLCNGVRGVVYYSKNVTMDGYIDDSPCLSSRSPCGIESSVQIDCCGMNIFCTTMERETDRCEKWVKEQIEDPRILLLKIYPRLPSAPYHHLR